MKRRPLRVMVLMLGVVPALVFAAGGWSIITVDVLPEYLVVDQPTEISFKVRQHGTHMMGGLQPRVEALSGGRTTLVKATAGERPGEYTAQLSVPEPGEWKITIHSAFGAAPSALRRVAEYGPNQSVLLPIRAVAGGAAVPTPATAADRGARLFVAKGCVGCHVHVMVGRPTPVPAGPELTARRYPGPYLEKLLADPASVQGARPGVRMPNLELRPAEIQALVAFINSDPAPARK